MEDPQASLAVNDVAQRRDLILLERARAGDLDAFNDLVVCYQDQLFSQEIRDLNASSFLAWRSRFKERLERIAARYPPQGEVDIAALADMASTLVEGGLILGRALKDVSILPRQLLLYRELVRATFQTI